MGIFFQKSITGFSTNPKLKIYNKRVEYVNLKVLNRIDLTFQSTESYRQASYPYLTDVNMLKQLLPVPGFLLKPLLKYDLHYETSSSDVINFCGKKTVIYLHGSGSISEDNSILQRTLIENDCDLIRVSYHIEYEKEGIRYPKKAEDMLQFLKETDIKIGPIVNEELKSVLSKLKIEYPDLFEAKEVILIAHSLGSGFLANLAVDFKAIKFSKFINLDGTLLNPAINTGLDIWQLHLSQDGLFKTEWIGEDNAKEPLKAIGQDYYKRINNLINHSTKKSLWIQVKNSTHFTFTDFPNLMKPYKIFRKIAGSREAAERIRKYVLAFILHPDELKIDLTDCELTHEKIMSI